ncbi:hypothetical protein EVAR_37255_1 [Eumeta japonica]|uniref:Uncharacterized protein n=1 Tax=Eumeta variegata TaxID=151549 RepID=A0A4C1WM78_EUMVA|nr:hypothetical protein EVAR_37255_1 [Eumeta japonica]
MQRRSPRAPPRASLLHVLNKYDINFCTFDGNLEPHDYPLEIYLKPQLTTYHKWGGCSAHVQVLLRTVARAGARAVRTGLAARPRQD